MIECNHSNVITATDLDTHSETERQGKSQHTAKHTFIILILSPGRVIQFTN